VQLTWIPSPLNLNFTSYSIYYNIQKNGTYTLLTNAITPINTSTYLHAPASATAQSFYYYMVANYTSGPSVSSDTLRTIFLNLFIGLDDLKLTYNQVHEPRLITTSSTFTVTKEYPIGSTGTLAVTTSTSYADTISVCGARINYQAFVGDNSGCVSRSNMIVGTYTDTKTPDTTYVDSVSVLPNGNTVISWQPPPLDKDVVLYYIMENEVGLDPDSKKNYLDTVNGRSNNSYTLANTNANSGPVSLFVAARDSCPDSDVGNFDPTPVSMFLKTVYNQCDYQTDLSWNAYKSMRKGIKEYRIYYSVNGSPFTIVGTTTTTAFRHENVDPEKNVCYFVRVVNSDVSITASSNQVRFFSVQSQVPAYLYVRNVTVTMDNKAVVNVHVDPMKPTVGIDIQRSDDSLAFITVGTLPYNGGSAYTFTDNTAQPPMRYYYYRAVLRDSCGNSRTQSNVARTILLSVAEDAEELFTRQLSWSYYEGFAGSVSAYQVYRSVNESPPALITTLPPEASSYTDNVENAASMGARVDYFVQAAEGTGNPFGIADRSNSNLVPVYMEGRLYVPNAFAPAGVNKTWKPVTHFIDKREYRVSVFNRWGKKVFETNNDRDEWDGSGCIPGVYVYQVSYRNARGEYLQVNGTVALIE
jgi:hypothetical protein